MVLKLWPERTARFRLTVYVCNYDGLPEEDRFQNMTVVDAADTQSVMVTDFARGEYITWTVDSRFGDPVTILAYDSGSAFPVISALFFDPDTETSGPVSPIGDRSTGGDWVGRYGRDGSLLFAWEMGPRDIGKLPSYINAVTGGERVWVDTGEAERSEIAMLYAPGFSPLLAHAWLLGNDLIHYLRPADAALQQRALASPPWRYVHGLEVHSPHPEYGLGIDLWPLAARQMFASHAGVMSAVWVLEGLFLTGLAIAAGMVVRAWKQSGPINPSLPSQSWAAMSGYHTSSPKPTAPSPTTPDVCTLRLLREKGGTARDCLHEIATARSRSAGWDGVEPDCHRPRGLSDDRGRARVQH
jgi:hypothetical protein